MSNTLSQGLGHLWPHTTHAISMALRHGLNQVGEKNTTSWSFCQNSPTPVSMRSPCHEDELFLLLRLKPSVRSSGNLERRWSLSLSKTFSFPPSFFSPLFFFPHPTVCSKMGQVGCPLMSLVNLSLAPLDYLIPLSIYFGFQPNYRLPHVT